MNKNKIINDPIYGLVRIPYSFLLDLIDDKRFQRLRRIHQMGLSHLVYPGAVHTRFHHALGAMHICWRALKTLRDKGTTISDEEAESCLIAILLHDIGHGPYSHALEKQFISVSHEYISLAYMEELNADHNGALDMAIAMYINEYPRPFFHQLISSQLDMDRIDYLNRDSFYSGVIEGKIGYDRIITMLDVVDDVLVVEEKAIFSVEKYLFSRDFMYKQVYLHKASLAAEQMLGLCISLLRGRAADLKDESEALRYFLLHDIDQASFDNNRTEALQYYNVIDDTDIISCLKRNTDNADEIIQKLSRGLLDRNLFGVIFKKEAFTSDFLDDHRQKIARREKCSLEQADQMMIVGSENKALYRTEQNEIHILMKNGDVRSLSDLITINKGSTEHLFYLCSPKL